LPKALLQAAVVCHPLGQRLRRSRLAHV
jgi:hypothetical protein